MPITCYLYDDDDDPYFLVLPQESLSIALEKPLTVKSYPRGGRSRCTKKEMSSFVSRVILSLTFVSKTSQKGGGSTYVNKVGREENKKIQEVR